MSTGKAKRRIILVIRDGWGYRKEKNKNFIASTPTPKTDALMKEYPNTLLKCSGEAVGLPDGYQGNSEVGHMTIGSGRIVFQSMERINHAIKTGEFFKNPAFLKAIDNCKKNKTHLHLIGLVQVEGVHSHLGHLLALLELCKMKGFHDVYVHAITDGRDAPVNDSIKNVGRATEKMRQLGFGKIATLSGRYYAMDRNSQWDRTRQAYDCIVGGVCTEEFADPLAQLRKRHKAGETDEFIVPCKLDCYSGVKPKDSIVFFNFRTDRTRQLTQAIVEKEFAGWSRKPLDVTYVAMTQFYKPMNALVAFGDQNIRNILGEVISREGMRQLRISETEKYAHVTFFFNSQQEKPFDGEDRILINSPKVATYDLKPEMGAYEIADALVKDIVTGKHDFIVTNLVNGDMVGHTGRKEAIAKAVKAVDECVGMIVDAGLESGYTLLVFADHGNAEDKTAAWATSHTINPVPFILVSGDPALKKAKLRKDGGLSDVAPTILGLMGLKQPKEMTGRSLIQA
jgi:2,3-bisphosphoglycerate-independent phosphoglycerate mutase